MMCVPKRAASCFPQDFPGKVLGGATPGIHSGSWADSHAQLIVRVSVSRILQPSPCGHPYFPCVHRLSDLFSSLLWHQNWRYPENFEKEMNRSIGSAGAFFLRPTQFQPFSLQPSHITLDTCLVESPFRPSGLVNVLDKWYTHRESALCSSKLEGYQVCVMVHFMCQSIRCPGIWLYVISGYVLCLLRVFLEETNIWISRMIPNVGRPHRLHWRPE